MTAARRAQTTSEWSSAIPDRLEAAVRNYDFPNSPSFVPLQDLSHATEFDAISVDSNVIVVRGRQWSAPATVYVTLVYRDSPSDPEPVRSAAAFPATVLFELADDDLHIRDIQVDVSSFYE